MTHTCEAVSLQPFRYLPLNIWELVHECSWMLLDCTEAFLMVSTAKLCNVQDHGLNPFARGHRVWYPLMLCMKVHVSEPLVLAVRINLKCKWIDDVWAKKGSWEWDNLELGGSRRVVQMSWLGPKIEAGWFGPSVSSVLELACLDSMGFLRKASIVISGVLCIGSEMDSGGCSIKMH